MDIYKVAKIWFLGVMILLFAWFIIFPKGLVSHMVLFIWIISGIAVLYRAKNSKSEGLSQKYRPFILLLGFFVCVFSFISVPMGFGNPPYSIAEFSIFLSGITLILFAYLEFKPLLLPSGFPLLTILGFQVYEIFKKNVEWIAEPMIAPTVNLTVLALNILGIDTHSEMNTIVLISRDGMIMNIPVVIDCTGIWSLGAFTASIVLVGIVLPNVFSKKGAPFILFGYIGTYLANILRVTLICISVYLYGYSGTTQLVHIHAGWIAFTICMVSFRCAFSSRDLPKSSGTEPGAGPDVNSGV